MDHTPREPLRRARCHRCKRLDMSGCRACRPCTRPPCSSRPLLDGTPLRRPRNTPLRMSLVPSSQCTPPERAQRTWSHARPSRSPLICASNMASSDSYRYPERRKAAGERLRAGSNKMCDYSLHTYPNRLAVDGEDLVVHRFGAGSLGLTSPADLEPVISAGKNVEGGWWPRVKAWLTGQNPRWEAEKRVPAVCIPPGARLVLRDIPKHLQR